MKKYVKPELFYESYELSQNIAACRWDVKLADEKVCKAYYDTDMENHNNKALELFTSERNCALTKHPSYCYQLGANHSKTGLFNS